MKIAVVSGKGGVGKSLVSAYLFALLSEKEKVVAIDCDVDNPSLRFWLGIEKFEEEIPLFLSEKAFARGKVEVECPFGAIKGGRIVQSLCHGCGFCREVEGEKVEMKKVLTGWLRREGNVIWGKLKPGETGSGKIVEELKRYAENVKHKIEVRDAPAGLGCSVKAALRDADISVIVVEPSISSLMALERMKELANHFKIRYVVVMNKVGLNRRLERRIRGREEVIGEVPYSPQVFNSLQKMKLPEFLKPEFEKIVEVMGW